jgi:outer membrane protein OmpA-like peptidoglycan-associated protein
MKNASFRARPASRAAICAFAALLGLAAVVTASSATAQARYFYLDRAQLSGAPDDGFMVWRPTMFPETRFYGSAALGYSHNPLRANVVTDNPVLADSIDNPIQGQFITYLMAGAQVANRAAFGLSLPIQLYKFAGVDPLERNIGRGGIEDYPVALHDLRVDARLRAYETGNLALGVGAAFWLPTGNSTAFAGDRGASTMIYGSGEYTIEPLILTGMIGPHIRPERSIGTGPNDALFIGSELRWAIGGFYPYDDRLRLGAELYGSTGLESAGPNETSTVLSGRNTPVEWLAQARYLLDKKSRVYAMGGIGTRLSGGYGAPDFRMLVSIGTYLTLEDMKPKSRPPGFRGGSDATAYERDSDGDGYPDSIDKCPNLKEDGKEPDPTDGCPVGADRDGDGIPDAEDECPDEPEDKDGIQDSDGCPETDADNDGVPDVKDECPLEIGLPDAVRPGCPGGTQFDEESGEVRLLKPIQFETGKAIIKPESFPILDEVVAVMRARPGLRMGVYGHTDNVGGAAMNLKLSKDRAASVMKYLNDKGVAASRLESEGYGLTKPIDTNNTADGRARNRRVEFKILN